MNLSRKNKIALAVVFGALFQSIEGFTAPAVSQTTKINLDLTNGIKRCSTPLSMSMPNNDNKDVFGNAMYHVTNVAVTAAVTLSFFLSPLYNGVAHAEDELLAKYGGKGFDTSLVDQNCLVDKCSLQAKACLADDPSCRKGLTCTAKCLGDNACITGCMARYGDANLDNLLKCTIEDNECIKVAILDGGADSYADAPRSIAPTVKNFNMGSMEGAWYKVVGFNPNYDCYACQRNTFSAPENTNVAYRSGTSSNSLQVDVEFSMPRMLPDGSPPPPSNKRENVKMGEEGLMYGSQSIGFNDYATHETMVFDNGSSNLHNVVLGKGENEKSYARTAHSEGEMFGLKFWENWYIIGENDPDQPEFKFVYYNGKTRQNTYEGAFVYSRTKELGPEAMKKVYKIAQDNGMNPDGFCKIRNGCFKDEDYTPRKIGQEEDPFRRIMASTKISQLLGVEPVAAENTLLRRDQIPRATSSSSVGVLSSTPITKEDDSRAWWYNVGDYLENPHRHFDAMDSLRITMDWPDYVKNQQ